MKQKLFIVLLNIVEFEPYKIIVPELELHKFLSKIESLNFDKYIQVYTV